MQGNDDEKNEPPLDPLALATEWQTIRRWARSYLTPNDRLRRFIDSDDLCQDVILEIVRGRSNFRGRSMREFFGWADTIMRRRVADRARDVDGMPDAAADVADESVVGRTRSPTSVAAENDEKERMHERVLGLPEPYRSVIDLKLRGMDHPEIATRLGISPENSRQRYLRALEMLREKP